ncbi:hypothetical protein [Mesorhizobium sp. KR9-304]|uniref:hypothetical protein n=1 Tax=Mesorhizobium sp. KR9-304 TaxID=3156614 RepID=UPI0032B43C23
MKRSIAIATLLLTSVFAGPALAQETTTTTGTQIETDANTTASTDAKANFGTVMSSIKAGKTNVSAITGLTMVNKVNVIRVGDLAKGNNMQALDKAITDNQADITGLQNAIGANAALKAKLDAESVEASSVVAANVEADGSVTVYVK